MKKLLIPNASIQMLREEAVKDELPSFMTAIEQLRFNLEIFQSCGFAGVPDARRLTMENLAYPNGWSVLDPGYVSVPFLRIRGKWLQKAGFFSGQHVQLIALKELLIIISVLILVEHIQLVMI